MIDFFHSNKVSETLSIPTTYFIHAKFNTSASELFSVSKLTSMIYLCTEKALKQLIFENGNAELEI